MEGFTSVRGRKVIFLLTLATLTVPTNQYFTYTDCGEKCANEGLSCNIRETINTFTVSCVDGDTCEDNYNEDIPCISEDEPTKGGSNLWPSFRERNPPNPKPKHGESCLLWKTILSIQTLFDITIGLTWAVRKYLRYRAQARYDTLPGIFREGSPYQDTVEQIPPLNVTEADAPAEARVINTETQAQE